MSEDYVLELDHVYGNGDKDISFKVHAGEVLGLDGLIGAGRTEIAEVIFGVKPKESGKIIFMGKEINPQAPRAAINHGIALLTEDRKRHGALLTNSIKNNISMPIYERISKASVINSNRIIVLAENKIMGELQKDEFNSDTIMTYASGIVPENKREAS